MAVPTADHVRIYDVRICRKGCDMTVQSIDALMGAMSFTEKVGQLNQRLLGW